ncbi:MAG TPA: Asp23/Gls24 family envelope stress response protein [Streptosporangiaceae bacterium]|nr:Asp23/Gls24 family envelope stress response protein [Streptosporangiaceae bacterium]
MSALDLAAPPTPLAVPGQRGRTPIAARVVAQVATRAVAEVAQTGGAARQLIGFTLGRQTGQGSARVSARVDRNLAMIEIRLTLAYPAPVRSLSREVRRHVMERVASLTGIEVRHVDIEVARLLRGRQR